ncbi:MAG: RNA polymerase sigma factor [Cytophagales bacterium]|nr:RNA polymerase sigma factor [Cytophagales bacterium]
MLTQWVNQYGDALYSWAFHKTIDEAIAQDLVQETFIAAYQKLDTFKNASSPKTWLFGILKNK